MSSALVTSRELTSWFPSPRSQVRISGVGARTPLGFNARSSAAAVRGGISAIEADRAFRDKAGEPMNLARDAALDVTVPIAERIAQMLSSVIDEVLPDRIDVRVRDRIQCWIGTPEARPGLPESLALSVVRAASTAGGFASSAIHVLPVGHASGLMAIQAAAQAIAARETEMALVVAADSYHDAATLEWLDRAGFLMSAENRNGFPPGEAAGACLLASEDAARLHGLPELASIAGAATSFEPNSIRATTVCKGEGLTAAMRAALAGLNAPQEGITATYCDLNGERYRNEEFLYTLLRVQEAFLDAHAYSSPADCWGDVGAASGPLFVALAVAAYDRGYAAGTVPLLCSGSESGYRSAVVLRLHEHSDVRDLS